MFASLERMDWTLVEAATDLGAKPFNAFRQITLRLTLPGVVTGALLVFIPMSRRVHHPEHPRRREVRVRRQRDRRPVRVGAEPAVRLGAVDRLMIALSVFVVVYILFATKEERFGA